MTSFYTVEDALAVLDRSSLPSVLTEGSDDYRVMRQIERNLNDCGLDFMPLGGREVVLEVWKKLPTHRKSNTLAIVDLDCWMYFSIPQECQGDNILYTIGYSIENDIFLDADLLSLMDVQETVNFCSELELICKHHAREIEKARIGADFNLRAHANTILANPTVGELTQNEENLRNILINQYGQCLRGKTLFQLITRQLSRDNRYVKFGYKHLYEIASANLGPILKNLEVQIRTNLCE